MIRCEDIARRAQSAAASDTPGCFLEVSDQRCRDQDVHREFGKVLVGSRETEIEIV